MDLPSFDQTNEGRELPDLRNEVRSVETFDNESGTVEPLATTVLRHSLQT